MDAVSRNARPHPAAVAGALLAAAVVLAAATACAHVFPDHSDPRVGATVNQPPDQVRIWFDGEIEPVFSTIRVENADRQQVDRRDAQVNGQDTRLLQVSLPSLQPGRYRVYWSVVARDGHRTEGDFPFRIK